MSPRRHSLRVLLFSDSPTMRAALRAALEVHGLTVVGEAADGRDAVAAVRRLSPDVVVMDVAMPHVDGYQATRAIMREVPTPILMVSAETDVGDRGAILAALSAGALHIAEPPPSHPAFSLESATFAALVRTIAGAQLGAHEVSGHPAPAPPARRREPLVDAVGLLASAGGPVAIARVLGELPGEVMPPILIVQHIARGFAAGFAEWLAGTCGHRVAIAVAGEPAEPGAVYVAPDDRHLGVEGGGGDLRLVVSEAPAEGAFRPSGSFLLRSLAGLGARARAVILTGMGDDGADGALALRRAGGRVAAQDRATSAIYGMPAAAKARGGVDVELPIGDVAGWLLKECGVS